MTTRVSMFEAKTNLSKYVASVEKREKPYVVIMRNGKPVARIVPYEQEQQGLIGLAKGKIPRMGSLENFNDIDIQGDFLGSGGIE